MEGNYCEARAKKRKTTSDVLIKLAIIAAVIISVLAAFLFGQTLLLLVAVGFGIAAYFVFPRLNVEYEYVFCDGQIDFDKVMNGEKRKHLMRIDMSEMAICGPINSHSLDGYKREGVRKVDFSSREEDARVWGIVITKGEIKTLYLFEPSDEMIRRMKQKNSKAVVEY